VSWNLLTKKIHVGGLFCDLEKALDYVNYEILLVQLQFLGTPYIAEVWFRCCVKNRRQKVQVTSPHSTKTFFSSWGTMKHGVPQGSILVPLLFVIYINDNSPENKFCIISFHLFRILEIHHFGYRTCQIQHSHSTERVTTIKYT